MDLCRGGELHKTCSLFVFLFKSTTEQHRGSAQLHSSLLFLISERYYWDAKLRIPTADYQEVLADDKAALAWLLALRRVGIVYLKGAPAEQGQVARLAERIGYLRLTFYG